VQASRQAVVRAVLITVVIASQLVEAAPIPHEVTRDHLNSPVGKEQLGWWSAKLGSVGFETTPTDLGSRLQTVTRSLSGAHKKILAPQEWLEKWIGFGQGWALFADPDTYPTRLSIRVRRGRSWELVFQNLDPEHAWSDPILRFRRIRGCYDAGSYRSRPSGPYRRFTTWVSNRLFAEDPTIEEVEVSTLRTHTTLPGMPPDPEIEVRNLVRTQRPSP
jgi:hypothetical protein